MEKVYTRITGSVDEEMLDKFIRLKDNANIEKENICIFESDGGTAWIGEKIVKIINSIPNFTLSAGCDISSCGFYIFFHSKCRKEVSEQTRGMIHIGSFSSNINHISIKKPRGSTNSTLENIKIFGKKELKFYKKDLWISKKLRDMFSKDYEVYFSAKQMKKMVNHQKNI